MRRVCRADELDEGRAISVDINGSSICLAKDEGVIYAFDNICSHDGGILGEAEIYDRQIECPRHGARFDIKTGEATQLPAVAPIGTYRVEVKDNDLFVDVPGVGVSNGESYEESKR